MDTARTIHIELATLPGIDFCSCRRSQEEAKADGRAEAYYVNIDSTKNPEAQAAAFLHECLHIWHSDFSSGQPAANIEADRADELRRILQALAEEGTA